MVQNLINFVLNIPQAVGQFGEWLSSPIGNGLDISPLGLFGIGGAGIIITIIGLHVVRLFV